VAGLLLTHQPAAADEKPVPCTTETDWAAIRGFINSHGEVTAAPVTTFLPADSNARIIFHQGLTTGTEVNVFRVYETNGAEIATFRQIEELPLLSVQAAPEKSAAESIAGFGPNDSVLLQVEITEQTFPLWHQRHFVVLSCAGGFVKNWGLVTARVSSRPISILVCVILAAVSYFLAMSAVRVSRESNHPLATKYPAIYGTKKIDWGDYLNPIHLTANAFNQASVQKLQVLLFSFLVGWLVLSLVLRTGALADLSLTVVGLLGISGVGAAVAQKTYQQTTRLSFENWAWLSARKVLKAPPGIDVGKGPQWRDLVLTNREFDVYKLQTIIFSVAVALAMVGAGASHLSTFAVPETLLGILGLSQVVYVGGILARPPATADLDVALTKLRGAEEAAVKAVMQGTDVGPDGTLLPGGKPAADLPTRIEAATNALRQYKQMADQIVVMIESTLEIEADRAKLDPELV
jgi:hypothetical protein